MDSWVTAYEYGKLVCQDRLSRAYGTRRTDSGRRRGSLLLALRSVLVLFR